MASSPKISSSLKKALTVLNCFVEKPSWGVTELSSHLGLNKSNAYIILSTFKHMGYLDQDETSGQYRLGIGLFALSRALGNSVNITQIAMPYMQEISNRTGERVYLGIPNADEVIYLASTCPTDALHLLRTITGERAKMYCTGIGKAILAFLPKAEREDYIHRELTAYTESTITDPDLLRDELDMIRINGFSVDNMEHEFGIKCVAMPIFDRNKCVEGSISISGPSLRFPDDRIIPLSKVLGEYVKKIEARL